MSGVNFQSPTPNSQRATRRSRRRLGSWKLGRIAGWELAALLLIVSAAGCGKKGAPLAPISHVPSAVGQITARRIGHDIYLTLTVPNQNIDKTMPADVDRIEIYGVTATAAPPRTRFLEIASPVATVPVAPPPKPTDPTPAAPVSGALQGLPVVVHETLTADAIEPRTLPIDPRARARDRSPDQLPGAAATATAPVPARPRRFYVALAFSERGRPGPPSQILEVPLATTPDPPASLDVEYTADTIVLTWPPSGGLIGFLLANALPPEPPPVDDIPSAVAATSAAVDTPAGPTRYNVYREVEPDPLVLPSPQLLAEFPAPPTPINAAPLSALAFNDPLDNERRHCYTVRAVLGAAQLLVEGDPSPRVCIVPVDITPPAAPVGLAAVVAEGAISLIWEPNAEADIGGYLVLRGRAGDATLQPLTSSPIPDARYTDRTVTPGEPYVYAIVAVDSRVPVPNVSAESFRVEETAR